MAKEIERKYLVIDNSYRAMARSSVRIVQGYISRTPESTVRVRLKGERGFLTIKGANHGATRDEWEYEIPKDEAVALMENCCFGNVIDKTRFLVDFSGYTWEIDEFNSPCRGLVVAEVELQSETDLPTLPPFIGKEVTGDPRYYNSNL